MITTYYVVGWRGNHQWVDGKFATLDAAERHSSLRYYRVAVRAVPCQEITSRRTMIAIQTRFIGPTNHRDSRVVAECMEKTTAEFKQRRLVSHWDHSLNVEDNHRAAAVALIRKLGWDNEHKFTYADWYCGGTERGYVFVCALDYAKVETAQITKEVA